MRLLKTSCLMMTREAHRQGPPSREFKLIRLTDFVILFPDRQLPSLTLLPLELVWRSNTRTKFVYDPETTSAASGPAAGWSIRTAAARFSGISTEKSNFNIPLPSYAGQ